MNYPETKRSGHTDDYHGTRVADPYRWLERSAHTPEVRAWIEAQNELTFDYLESLPGREAIEKRLTELWDYPKVSAPFRKGKHYFQFRNAGLQNQPVLYVMKDVKDTGRVLLNPNHLSEDGTAAVTGYAVSADGSLLAYAVAESGSDWVKIRVRDITTGEDLPDELKWARFTQPTWLPDGSGFFYQRFPKPSEGEMYTGRLDAPSYCLHLLGQDQREDEVVFATEAEPNWMYHSEISHDGTYQILYIRRSTEKRNLLYYRRLEEENFTPLVGTWEASYQVLGNDGETFYLHTDLNADRGRVVALELPRPEQAAWRTIIPESQDTLQACLLVGNTFFCLYMHHASHRVRRIGTDGEDRGELTLPGLGSINSLNAERDHDEVFFDFTSFLYPTLTFRFDVKAEKREQLGESGIKFDPAPYTTRQVFVTSKDGTQVPMFLVHRNPLKLDGNNPTLLYGYGGFNISLTPSFSVSRLAWLERGGVLAIANLRGGGEYGRAWHEAGILANKQNVFDDFIACAEWLTTEGVTSPAKLAIQGGSNGGLLVGAAMTQRPELFGAALPAVGVLDMLRYHSFTIGWAWASDYGSSDNPEAFKHLIKYSPLHSLKDGTVYPATLVTTGDFDDRVVPAHSFKFAAALQQAQAGSAPVLIRIQTKAGHGMGKPTKMLIQEQADIWAFLVDALNMAAA